MADVSSGAPAPRPRLLLVDDDTFLLSITARILRPVGYDVELAASGEEALQRFAHAREAAVPFDGIVTDLQMPGISGLELIATLIVEVDRAK